MVISSLAVVFIDQGVAVPRDLQKQFETKKKITPDIVENRLVALTKVFVPLSRYRLQGSERMLVFDDSPF